MGFVDRRARLRGADAAGIDPTVTGVEEHRLVAVTFGGPERHAGAGGEGGSVEGLRLRVS